MDTSVGVLDRAAPVYIAGHRGLAGSALFRRFQAEGFTNLLVRSHSELDLTDRAATFDFVLQSKPHVIVDAAARVGGIMANSTYPVDEENLGAWTHTSVRQLNADIWAWIDCQTPRPCLPSFATPFSTGAFGSAARIGDT